MFGAPSHSVMDAMDYLASIDPDGAMQRSLTMEISMFRNSYQVVEGFEDALIQRVTEMCRAQTEEWCRKLTWCTLSIDQQKTHE